MYKRKNNPVVFIKEEFFMELKINSIIKAHSKVSYAVESAGPRPYDID